jgi:F0F1-type ATP synthase membrane subunit b/b'
MGPVARISNDWLGAAIQSDLNHASRARQQSEARQQRQEAAAQGLDALKQAREEAVASIQASAVQQADKVADIKEAYSATLGQRVNAWA